MLYDTYDDHGNKVGVSRSSHIIAIHGHHPHVLHVRYLSIKWILHVFLNITTLLGYGNIY